MIINRMLIIASIVSITGCTGFSKPPAAGQQRVEDESAIQLTEAAVSVSQSLNELAALEKTAAPTTKLNSLSDPNINNLPGAVSVDWSGPVEPLLDRLGAMSNYRVRVLGVKPAIPVIVTLNASNTPLAHLLRNIDYQCGHKAKLLVYPGQQIIELRYANN